MEDSARSPFALRALRVLKRVLTDRAERYEKLMHFGLLPGGFQPARVTSDNRYPGIFAHVRSELGAECTGHILSFGCATGEEVFTLRRYFPRATIKGIDINPGNIAVCRRQAPPGDSGLSFKTAGSTAAEPSGSYDAIFCMAVLRHGKLAHGPPKSTPLLDFADFARVIGDAHRCLRPGGLLAVRHSHFRVCDAPAAAGFESVFSVRHGPGPLYGPDNALLPDTVYPDCVFRKR